MSEPPDTGGLLAEADGALLDLIDHLLNKGVVVTGEVILGLADIDLVYLRLTALLCAADRVLPPKPARSEPSEPSESETP